MKDVTQNEIQIVREKGQMGEFGGRRERLEQTGMRQIRIAQAVSKDINGKSWGRFTCLTQKMAFLKLKEITVFHILSLTGEGKITFLKTLQLLGKEDEKGSSVEAES